MDSGANNRFASASALADQVSSAYSGSKDKGRGGLASYFQGINLKTFDLYTKIDENYLVKTTGGGYLSLAGWIIILIMIIGQTYTFVTPRFHEHMVVNTTLGEKLTINLDITFHALTCAEAHLDAMDVAGDNQLNMEDTMFKQRLSPSGAVIGSTQKAAMNSNVKLEDKKLAKSPDANEPTKCLSCYGAESGGVECCNTCQSLKDAYASLGWSTSEVLKNAVQCKEEQPLNPYADVEKGEGCRVYGSMSVNRVAGNIHIAHGESIVRDGQHIHQFVAAEASGYNISHTIHSMSFGKAYPGMPSGPLDKKVHVIEPKVGTGLFQYFIKVIPTVYSDEFKWRGKTYTNQYTMTERFRPLMLPEFPRLPDGSPDYAKGMHMHQQAVLPGIFFVYDVSPFLVEVVRSRVPFWHFFTRLCSTVGGVFAVLGVVDRAWYSMQKWIGDKSSNAKI